MLKGYVSTDEDESDSDFGYSEPLAVRKTEPSPLLNVQTSRMKSKLEAALEESEKMDRFLKALDNGDLEVLEELISSGMSVDDIKLSVDDWTPLMKSCAAGKTEVVEFLLQNGSNPNHHKELFTPLMACCTHTLVDEDLKLECVRLLLQHGADANAADKHRTTALMYAAGSGYLDIVDELLTTPQIQINLQDKEGWSALFYAVTHNNVEIAKRLISAGADVELKDRQNRTVMNLTLDKNLKEMAKALGYKEEILPDLPPKETGPTQRYLRELPAANGQGGFPSETRAVLSVFNQHIVKDVGFPDFLNMTENDLYDVGVKLNYDRKKILAQGIHRYHLHPWTKTSMPQIQKGVPLSTEDVVVLTGSIAKHLTVANASLRYLDTRISSRLEKGYVNVDVEKELAVILMNTYNAASKLKSVLPKILSHIDQIKPEIPADFIFEYSGKMKKSIFKRLLWFTVVAAGVIGLLGHIKKKTPMISPKKSPTDILFLFPI